jgi:hypothetical protein
MSLYKLVILIGSIKLIIFKSGACTNSHDCVLNYGSVTHISHKRTIVILKISNATCESIAYKTVSKPTSPKQRTQSVVGQRLGKLLTATEMSVS